MAFYADEYLDLNLREPRQTRQQRADYFHRLLARRTARVAVTPAEIVVCGDHAVVRGTILLTPLDGARPPRELRYMELVRHFRDGWKAVWGIDADVYAE
jgi:hypothetical protein